MNIDIKRVKIVVCIPYDYVEKVRDDICSEGAGRIGNYSFCSITSKVIDTFIPLDGSKPFIGECDKLECVLEEKLEVVWDINLVSKIIKIIRDVHPYEEPGIDIIPLIDEEYFRKNT